MDALPEAKLRTCTNLIRFSPDPSLSWIYRPFVLFLHKGCPWPRLHGHVPSESDERSTTTGWQSKAPRIPDVTSVFGKLESKSTLIEHLAQCFEQKMLRWSMMRAPSTRLPHRIQCKYSEATWHIELWLQWLCKNPKTSPFDGHTRRWLSISKAMCFFFYVSRHFFFTKPTWAREKKTKCPKKKNNGSVSKTTWPTNSWYLTSLRGQRTCSNLQPTRDVHQHCECIRLAKIARRSRWEARPRFRFRTKHISWCFCQSKTSLLSAESSFDDFNRKDLCFGFQWLDSVTRLLPPNSRKRTWRCFQSFGECAWMASIMLFRIMVWDVHPIIYLHPTAETEKVLLPPRNNREEIATSTQLFSASATCKCCAHDTCGQQLWFCDPQFFFFFGFQPKARRAGDEKHRQKSTWPNAYTHAVG